jgi:hypothetical protein
MGMDMVVTVPPANNRSKAANYEMVHSEDMRRAVAESLGEPYDGSVPVRHFVEMPSRTLEWRHFARRSRVP